MNLSAVLSENDYLFEKKFSFVKQNDWVLPSYILKPDILWSINSLNAIKKKLNETKSFLNDKGQDWHDFTAAINKAAYILKAIKEKIHPEILTQAWCKFFEILSTFTLISTKSCVRTLHLCEAPGAFISALNYFLCVHHSQIEWEWTANALNPYYEGHSIRSVVGDDRLILPTLKHWYFGEDNTGDITDSSFIDNLCTSAQETDLFDLITADGSVDCADNPGEQELVVEKLHFCEFLIALSCLAPHGCFVLKKFTFFECSTICQLYVLNCAFEKVCVFKPFTSKSSNSEVYVVCIGFLGSDALTKILQQYKEIYSASNVIGIFPLSNIPDSFIQQLEECMKYFTDLQIKAINENLALYSLKDNLTTEKLNDLKQDCADNFLQKYPIFSYSIYESSKLFSKSKVQTNFCYESTKNMKSLYYNVVGDSFNNIKKSSSMLWYDKLLDVEKRLDACFPTTRKRPIEKIEWQTPWKEIRKRMKSKSFDNWIRYGKQVTFIQNSKFCYPLLLYLWNRISLDPKVDPLSHINSACYWYSDVCLEFLFKDEELAKYNIITISPSQNCDEDSLLSHLKQKFNLSVISYLNMEASFNKKWMHQEKVIYINTAAWENSLHSEFRKKKVLTEILLLALKIFQRGDLFFFCVQSVLTRYMAGLIFLIISLFDKFATILPEESASALSGQIWVCKNFQDNQWTNKLIDYLEKINELNSSHEKEILEIVPLYSLCNSSFLNCLRNLNNKHLLQRLKNLIAVEKSKASTEKL